MHKIIEIHISPKPIYHGSSKKLKNDKEKSSINSHNCFSEIYQFDPDKFGKYALKGTKTSDARCYPASLKVILRHTALSQHLSCNVLIVNYSVHCLILVSPSVIATSRLGGN